MGAEFAYAFCARAVSQQRVKLRNYMYVYDTEGPEGGGRATEGKEEGQGGKGGKGQRRGEKQSRRAAEEGREGGEAAAYILDHASHSRASSIVLVVAKRKSTLRQG